MLASKALGDEKKKLMMLQKWLTLSDDQFSPEFLKACENMGKQHINLLQT
jgi:hypothetical protein